MSKELVKLKKKDFETDQDVRWCPGCGDYAILATVQRSLATMGVPKEKQVFISGIGCSSRFPYYVSTFGFHSIHGRAPAIASGLKTARPDLTVWVITGDGDSLSIGGNHLLHVLRRNVNVKILLFNNQIYGLTKGQYSPTSQVGTKAPSTPYGSIDEPVNPIAFALGANASFVARVGDTDAKLLGTLLQQAHEHQGTALIEIMQNCPVFNDGVWAEVSDKKTRADKQIVLQDGQPLLFGKDKNRGIRLKDPFTPEVFDVTDDNKDQVLTHQAGGPLAYGQLLASLSHPEFPVPVGVLRQVQRTVYDQAANAQVQQQVEVKGKGKLEELLASGMTWTVD